LPTAGHLQIGRLLNVREMWCELIRRRLARLDPSHEVLELDPIRPRGAANDVERLVDLEAVALGEYAFRLFDRHARLQGLFELGPPLVAGLGDGQQAPDGDYGLFWSAPAKGLDGAGLGVLAHGA